MYSFARYHGTKGATLRIDTYVLVGLGVPHPNGSAHVEYRCKVVKEK